MAKKNDLVELSLGELVDELKATKQEALNLRFRNATGQLENTAEISYCWHQKLRILVGGEWWCQWWEEIPE